MALYAPALAEADVREADGAPGEDGGEAGDGQHPVECVGLFAGGGEEGEEAQDGGDDDGEEGATFAVDVGEESWGLTLFGQGGEGS